ncbi:hypothetical protein GUITHDRAFT_155645 [Guillardia theta CCMP2712]|uniref:Uncharacterized protein n=1 Tax=Guillardia theta (strain CCMP2712) TaxID=905079 RepID=L1IEQ3_GUITC|nr:hypothetical protein GUITHDRAFT_155645 [Guillardia theta CCMP2712]EKX34746.1 hypothetical protein GUITHDRAFT_155645 [Guillardia theta CCMP2712]|mmetsp:Transcript_47870/g.150151  ORF Transcript_47870/g.150151 Transcript_47870/m.150151 type:complete len:108 (+) Transcript_47870:159-482(+)|eukprot:XP_005821726.1 hypothetical protein GUITHDRAFT_155645 [Guillardia theta CCMP2712]
MSCLNCHSQEEIYEGESRWIKERRQRLDGSKKPLSGSKSCEAAKQDVRHLDDTFGVCISPGGMRSAAFSLGALEQLSQSVERSFNCYIDILILHIELHQDFECLHAV